MAMEAVTTAPAMQVASKEETVSVVTSGAVEVVEIEFDELGRFEALSMCCSIIR